MGEFFITLFLFVAVAMITAIIFGGWAIALAFQGMGRMFGSLFAPPPPTNLTCSNRACGQVNPASATYCRRCGRVLRARSIV